MPQEPLPLTARVWRADRFGGPHLLELVEGAPVPVVMASDVLVKVLSCDVSYADFPVLSGLMPGVGKEKLPIVGGCDAIGKVLAVGSGVTKLAVGDRVAFIPMYGCLATYAVLPAIECIKIREDVSPDVAVAAVMTGITTYHLLYVLGAKQMLNPTEVKILVHACVGGTGAALIDLAKAAGVSPKNIYGTCSGKNVATASAMGIHALNYELKGDQAWDAVVLKETSGRGVDLVYDSITCNGYFSRGLGVLARGGRIVAYGMTNKNAPGTIASLSEFLGVLLFRVKLQNLVLSWFDGGRTAEFFLGVQKNKYAAHERYVGAVMDLIAQGKIKPFIGKIWTFDEAKNALMAIAKSSHQGKQVVHIADA